MFSILFLTAGLCFPMIDNRVKFRHLQTFVEVARQKSVMKAAELLHVSQPAVTKTIRELEEVLGVSVFERDGRGIRITRYGEAFLEVHSDSLCEGDSVLIFDDLIATGGTLIAAANLARRMGAKIFEAAAIIDLPELGGSQRLEDMGIPTFCLTQFGLSEQ